MPDIASRILDRERRGYLVLEAIQADGRQSGTFSRSCVFTAVDGNGYWVKAEAQQGLVAELICGRLARIAHRAPNVQVIRVTKEALPNAIDCSHLTGVVFGSQDMSGAVNARDLQPLIGGATFDPNVVSQLARARVIAFQTWMGVNDAQVLVRLTAGDLFSFDHGAAFQDVSDRTDPKVVVTDIPGVDLKIGKRPGDMAVAIKELEAITDNQILDSVSNIPHGEPWRSLLARRSEIAEFLIDRRSRLQGVLMGWARS